MAFHWGPFCFLDSLFFFFFYFIFKLKYHDGVLCDAPVKKRDIRSSSMDAGSLDDDGPD